MFQLLQILLNPAHLTLGSMTFYNLWFRPRHSGVLFFGKPALKFYKFENNTACWHIFLTHYLQPVSVKIPKEQLYINLVWPYRVQFSNRSHIRKVSIFFCQFINNYVSKIEYSTAICLISDQPFLRIDAGGKH